MRNIVSLVVAIAALLFPAAAAGQVSLVSDINPGAGGSGARGQIQPIGATSYFWADDGVHGLELWKSNGTSAGTVLVKDIRPGPESARPTSDFTFLAYMAVLNGTLYFAADDGVHGVELWKSNGTADGTVLVKDIYPGSRSSDPGAAHGLGGPGRIVAMGGALYFPARTEAAGTELHRSAGSAGTTTIVKDIIAGANGASPHWLTVVGGSLYFSAFKPNGGGVELFKSDGTAAATAAVRDINPGSGSSRPSRLTDVGGTLYFRAFTPASGEELWRSRGTEASTVQVRDISPGVSGSMPESLTARGSVVLFVATDARGVELWKSDATSGATSLVRDINPGNGSSSPGSLHLAGDRLYFGAFEPATGVELWRSDGSFATTVRVSDIQPGPTGSSPFWLSSLNGVPYFSAWHPSLGNELFALGASGPVLKRDIHPGGGSGSPSYLTPVRPSPLAPRLDYLLFVADDGVRGLELWKLVPASSNG